LETQKTVIQAKPVTLSMEAQESIKTHILDCWNKGKADREPYETHWKECEDAYHCRMPKIESPELDWMSNECLPWAFDAAESWYAHIHSTTIPKNDQIFTISGRTDEDHPGAEVMQKYLEYRFERNHYAQQLGKAYDSLKTKNHACLKVYWKEETTVEYPWVDEPVMGIAQDPITGEIIEEQVGTKKVRKPQETTYFNNVWIDVVPIENFVMYPIRGDFNQTTRIQETHKFYEDLMASANKTNYFNLNELSLDDEQQEVKQEGKKTPKGLNIKEAWIHRIVIDGKVYRNYVATLVNDKTLIRFQPFPPGCPKSPYVFMALRPDGDCFYGYGLNSKGLGILRAANRIFNSKLDEIYLRIHPPTKYYEDSVFNPNNVINRPGALIKVTKEGMQDQLIPLMQDMSPLQIAYQEVAELKVEFETVTVPKVVKGMIEVGGNNTATEITQAQNNSSGKMHIDAFNINDKLIKPVLELSYQAIYDRLQFDDTIYQEIQEITQPKDEAGNPLAELPVVPLPNMDIKVVGYQNVIRKQEQLMGIAQALPQIGQSPAGKYLNWVNVAEDTFQLMDLDRDRLLMNEEERAEVDERDQQAAEEEKQLLIAKEQEELRLKAEKQQQDFQIKLAELEIKKMELQLKFQQQAHTEAMGQHNAQMSERTAQLSEFQAQNKEQD